MVLDNRLIHTSMCSVCCIAYNILECVYAIDCIVIQLLILLILGHQKVGHGHMHHEVLLNIFARNPVLLPVDNDILHMDDCI